MGVRSRDKKKFNGGGTVYSGWDSNQTSPNLHEIKSHKKGKLKIFHPDGKKQNSVTEPGERGNFKNKLNRKPANIYK